MTSTTWEGDFDCVPFLAWLQAAAFRRPTSLSKCLAPTPPTPPLGMI